VGERKLEKLMRGVGEIDITAQEGWCELDFALPEKALAAMVLMRAIWDIADQTKTDQFYHGEDAKGWLYRCEEARADEKGMTFLYCCEVLNLNPKLVRKAAKGIEKDGMCIEGRRRRVVTPWYGTTRQNKD
jgi:hypothetical protein